MKPRGQSRLPRSIAATSIPPFCHTTRRLSAFFRTLAAALVVALVQGTWTDAALASPGDDARPYILLTNDDGVAAPGIRAMRAVLETFADLLVVAPDRDRSGASESLTLGEPIRVTRMAAGGAAVYAASATPASCVHLALDVLAERPVELVVSGINSGHNIGMDLSTSGTVGAARLAVRRGVPAVALSLEYGSEEFDSAARAAGGLVRELLARKGAAGIYLLNVNFPRGPPAAWKSPRLVTVGGGGYTLNHVKEAPAPGEAAVLLFRPKVSLYSGVRPEGSDAAVLRAGHPTVTPVAAGLEASALPAALEELKFFD